MGGMAPDEMPARVLKGEAVLDRATVRRIGGEEGVKNAGKDAAKKTELPAVPGGSPGPIQHQQAGLLRLLETRPRECRQLAAALREAGIRREETPPRANLSVFAEGESEKLRGEGAARVAKTVTL